MMDWGIMGWIGGIMILVFWTVIISAAVVFIRWLVSSERSRSLPPSNESALDILKKRYARGEINKRNMRRRKKIYL